jgi:hypothetical protein
MRNDIARAQKMEQLRLLPCVEFDGRLRQELLLHFARRWREQMLSSRDDCHLCLLWLAFGGPMDHHSVVSLFALWALLVCAKL